MDADTQAPQRILTTSSLPATVAVTAVFIGALALSGDRVLTLYATFSAVALPILEPFDGTASQRFRACALVGLGGAFLVTLAAFASQVVSHEGSALASSRRGGPIAQP